MKRHIAALAVSGLLFAIPWEAFAVLVWHCEAHPQGVPVDQHDGFGLTQGEAAANALAACEAGHGAGTCVVGLCHIDHH